jgi:hypothetical protein
VILSPVAVVGMTTQNQARAVCRPSNPPCSRGTARAATTCSRPTFAQAQICCTPGVTNETNEAPSSAHGQRQVVAAPSRAASPLERPHSRWVVVPALVPGEQPTRNLAHCVAAAFAARGQQRPMQDTTSALSHGGAALVELTAARPRAAHESQLDLLLSRCFGCHIVHRVSHGLTPFGFQTSQFHRSADSPARDPRIE